MAELRRITIENFVPGPIMPRTVLRHAKLSDGAKILFLYYCDGARLHESLFEAQETTADVLGWSASKVKRAVAELKKCKLLEVRQNQVGSRATYKVFAPVPDEDEKPGSVKSDRRGKVKSDRSAGVKSDLQEEHTSEEQKREPSAAADTQLEGLIDCKPAYGSVASQVREQFKEVSPGGKYRFTQADRAILKKIWDDVDDMFEITRIFASAALRREDDPFWARNWSVKFVYGQLGLLRNQAAEATEEEDVHSRVAEGYAQSIERTVKLHGIRPERARQVLREHGLEPGSKTEHFLQAVADGIRSPFWEARFQGEDAETVLAAAIGAFGSAAREPAGGGVQLPDPGELF